MNDIRVHSHGAPDAPAEAVLANGGRPPRPTMRAQPSRIAWSLVAAFALHGAALAALTGLKLATGNDPEPLPAVAVELVAVDPTATPGGGTGRESAPEEKPVGAEEPPADTAEATPLPEPAPEPTPEPEPEPEPEPGPERAAQVEPEPETLAESEAEPTPEPVAEVAMPEPEAIPAAKPVAPADSQAKPEPQPVDVAHVVAPKAKPTPPTPEKAAPENPTPEKVEQVAVAGAKAVSPAPTPAPAPQTATEAASLGPARTKAASTAPRAAAGQAAAPTPPSYRIGAAGNPAPRYPLSARRRGWQGRVVVEAVVDRTGAVIEIKIAESSGHRVLDRRALDTVRDWRFRPASRAGQAIAGTVKVPIVFRLKG